MIAPPAGPHRLVVPATPATSTRPPPPPRWATFRTDTPTRHALRLVCGLTTAEIARAFLVSEPTMAARVTRAKKKISAARIPYRVPVAADLPARLDAVLTVVHLLFTRTTSARQHMWAAARTADVGRQRR